MFEISTLKLFLLQNFVKRQKLLNLGSKIPYLVIFGLEFEKNIFIFEISVLVQLQKIFKFETKNALFGCFWAIILKRYCHI